MGWLEPERPDRLGERPGERYPDERPGLFC